MRDPQAHIAVAVNSVRLCTAHTFRLTHVRFPKASTMELHPSLPTWEHPICGSICDRASGIAANLVQHPVCGSISDRASCVAANLVTSGLWKHLRSSFMHCCQPGNVRFVEASSIEPHASLPTWEQHLPTSLMHRCQPGNIWFVEASPIELHASLPTW